MEWAITRRRTKQIIVGVRVDLYRTSCTVAIHAALKRACLAAAQDGSHDVLRAAVAATVVLENEPITNAGRGSNLTESGSVENDASVMRGDGLWAGVGAVQGISNPITAAHRLALDSLLPMQLGRVRPMYALVHHVATQTAIIPHDWQ